MISDSDDFDLDWDAIVPTIDAQSKSTLCQLQPTVAVKPLICKQATSHAVPSPTTFTEADFEMCQTGDRLIAILYSMGGASLHPESLSCLPAVNTETWLNDPAQNPTHIVDEVFEAMKSYLPSFTDGILVRHSAHRGSKIRTAPIIEECMTHSSTLVSLLWTSIYAQPATEWKPPVIITSVVAAIDATMKLAAMDMDECNRLISTHSKRRHTAVTNDKRASGVPDSNMVMYCANAFFASSRIAKTESCMFSASRLTEKSINWIKETAHARRAGITPPLAISKRVPISPDALREFATATMINAKQYNHALHHNAAAQGHTGIATKTFSSNTLELVRPTEEWYKKRTRQNSFGLAQKRHCVHSTHIPTRPLCKPERSEIGYEHTLQIGHCASLLAYSGWTDDKLDGQRMRMMRRQIIRRGLDQVVPELLGMLGVLHYYWTTSPVNASGCIILERAVDLLKAHMHQLVLATTMLCTLRMGYINAYNKRDNSPNLYVLPVVRIQCLHLQLCQQLITYMFDSAVQIETPPYFLCRARSSSQVKCIYV